GPNPFLSLRNPKMMIICLPPSAPAVPRRMSRSIPEIVAEEGRRRIPRTLYSAVCLGHRLDVGHAGVVGLVELLGRLLVAGHFGVDIGVGPADDTHFGE